MTVVVLRATSPTMYELVAPTGFVLSSHRFDSPAEAVSWAKAYVSSFHDWVLRIDLA